MAMTAFYTRFRELAFREMRFATIQGQPDLPDGQYGFVELYCDDASCDCRRVLINVVEANSKSKIWATINYGWDTPAYYAAWTNNAKLSQSMLGATLDLLNPQTPYAPALLRLFESMLTDPAYVDRLKRHYQMFKADVAKKTTRKSTNKLVRRKKLKRK